MEALNPADEPLLRHAGWAMALRGILAIAFGIIALRSPGMAAAAFVVVFAIYAFADGALEFWLAARFGRAGMRWGWYAFAGVASIALGVIALVYPQVTLLALVLLVAIRAVVLGIVELIAAFSWEGLDSRWLLGVTGVLSIILGILILGSPAVGGLALIWTIGVYAIVLGIGLLAHGARAIRLEHHHIEPPTMQRPAATAG
jgi:uncharacterized membrane protein HdeD (DUF308 family)